MTEQQKDFVQMYLKHRCKITAYNIAYGENPNYDSVESSANRLLNTPEIAEIIRSIKDGIRHEVEEEFKAKYREELLTIYDKRLLLKKIATGEMYIEQKYKGKNCTQCSQYISPTYHMMLQALKEDSKLAGHYPFKQNGKWVIPALQTEQEENSNNIEKDNKGQQLSEANSMRQLNKDINYELTPDDTTIYNTSPSGAGGEYETQNSNTLEKDNKRQQMNEITIDSQQLTENIGSRLSPENPPMPEPNNGAENNRQQNSYPDDAINRVTEPTQPPHANIISRDDLHELLNPTRKAYKAIAKTGTTNLIFAAEKQNHAL